jgi:hypothetical protein
VITVSPLLPIRDPGEFFARVARAADAVVIDHFIGGDGTPDGSRTRRTALPAAMEAVLPGSSSLAYRDLVVARACEVMPGRVGVGRDGFAGRMLPASALPPTRALEDDHLLRGAARQARREAVHVETRRPRR